MLDLPYTQVANLEPLKGLTALTTLNLSDTQVANLEPLKGLTALTELNLSNTQVANLEPLKGLNALTSLDLHNTQVANLEPLKGLTAVTWLNLSNTQVANLEPLKGLNALTTLACTTRRSPTWSRYRTRHWLSSVLQHQCPSLNAKGSRRIGPRKDSPLRGERWQLPQGAASCKAAVHEPAQLKQPSGTV